ncbi:hypothetical protein QCD60_06395 [Pokkaliibacter sp. MBI-7]|uniref:alpha/beta fold hydrolase n=1 Tax=Pokkaliibacter sp. MBI-7 TaxID=3040600 RepID=UPI002448797A|nr:alpha/beta fold hydrolase [Pokkaliibacter sp. MBI-7]MDH2432186.1 hypothetical protein [Pokkaliibacter sp. MBI-7]
MTEWVLINGWAMPDHLWHSVVERLSPQGTVHLLSPDRHAGTLAEAANSILAQAPERANWLGWSLGGRLLMEAAVQAPERIALAVTLAASPSFVATANAPGMSPDVFDQFIDAMEQQPLPTLRRFAGMVAQSHPQGRTLLAMLRDYHLGLSSEELISLSRQLQWLADDCCQRWAEVMVPQRHYLGACDGLVPSQIAEVLNGAMTVVDVLPDQGHLLHWPDTAWLDLSGKSAHA